MGWLSQVAELRVCVCMQMLYDNGQLAATYLDAFCATGDESYAHVARGVLDYLRRDMTHSDGGIFSAEVPGRLNLQLL